MYYLRRQTSTQFYAGLIMGKSLTTRKTRVTHKKREAFEK